MASVGSLSSQPPYLSTPRIDRKPPGSRNLTQTPSSRSVKSTALRILEEQDENSAFKHIGTHHLKPTFASIMQRKVTPADFEGTERKQPMAPSKSEKKVPQLANRILRRATPSVRRTPKKYNANEQDVVVQRPITSPMTPKKKKKAEFNVVAAHFLPDDAKELARLMAFSPPGQLPRRYAPTASPIRDRQMQEWFQAIPESIDKKVIQEWLQAIPLPEPSKTKFLNWVQTISTSKSINKKLIEGWISTL